MISVVADGDEKFGTNDKYFVWDAMLDKLACSLYRLNTSSQLEP